MPNSSYSTVQEQILQNELQRIRATYSFRLGLLLTNSFARKPWLLPLLPFAFIKMNIDFLRDRKKMIRSPIGLEYKLDNNCILLFPTSEEGMAVIERTKSIASEWIEAGKKAIIISTNDLMAQNIPAGALFYPLSDPKNISKQERTVWNNKCANMLANIIELHKPISVLFDGPFPYRGLINTISIKSNVIWIWLRIEEFKEYLTSEKIDHFDLTYFGSEEQLFSKEKEMIERSSIYSNKVLLAIDYSGKVKDWNRYSFLINKLSKEKIETVISSNSTIDVSPLYTNETWDSVSTSSKLSTLYAAIVRYDSFLISKLMARGIPTICILDKETNPVVDSFKIKSINYPLIIIENENESETELAITTIMNRESNKAMREMPVYISPAGWGSLFEEIQSRSK